MSLDITNSLKGALGELYYKEGCDQRGWAYISLENIHSSFNNELVFKKGFHRIRVRIPDSVLPEIKRVSQPTNDSIENPSFVFDFLACRAGTKEVYDKVITNPELCWVEIKTGESVFSGNQIEVLKQIRLPLAVFYIEDVLAPPEDIEIEWNMASGREWLADFGFG